MISATLGIELTWLIMGAALCAYALTGGADFGAGFWDLVARGERQAEERAVIEHAIAPIWEANHIWLILLVVLMFSVFPRAFFALSIALHIPLTLALVGIVLRGAAFSFRSYGLPDARFKRRWGLVFALGSTLSPIFLGMTLGALGTGEITLHDDTVTSGFWAGWTSLSAVALGLFTLALFTLLAAVYLALASDGAVRESFRIKALANEAVAGALAALSLWALYSDDAPLWRGLMEAPWAWPLQVAAALFASTTVVALWRRRYALARLSVGAQVSLVIVGFGVAMDRHLLLPDLPLSRAGARPETLAYVVPIVGVGAVVLAPALWYLFRVFRRATP